MRACVLLALALAPQRAARAAWTQQGGSASRSSCADARGPRGAAVSVDTYVVPRLANFWAAGPVVATPATDAAPAALFFADNQGTAYRVSYNRTDPTPLRVTWSKKYDTVDSSRSAPALSTDGTTIAVTTADANSVAVAFDVVDGTKKWALRPESSTQFDNTGFGAAPPLAVPADPPSAGSGLPPGWIIIDRSTIAKRLDMAGNVLWRTVMTDSFTKTSDTSFLSLAAISTFALLPRATGAPLVVVGLGGLESIVCGVMALDASSGAVVWNTTFSPCFTLFKDFDVSHGGLPVGPLAVTSSGIVVGQTQVLPPPPAATPPQFNSPPLLFALDGLTGVMLWNRSFLADFDLVSPPQHSVALSPDGGRAYTTAIFSTVFTVLCVNVSTGATVWSVTFADGFTSTPTVDRDDFVFVAAALGASRAGGGNVSIVALNGTDGSVAWAVASLDDNLRAGFSIVDEGVLSATVVYIDRGSGRPDFPRIKAFSSTNAAPSLTPTPSASPSFGASPSDTPSAATTASPTVTPSRSPTASPTASPSVSPTAAPTAATPSVSPTSAVTPSRSPSPSGSPAAAAAGVASEAVSAPVAAAISLAALSVAATSVFFVRRARGDGSRRAPRPTRLATPKRLRAAAAATVGPDTFHTANPVSAWASRPRPVDDPTAAPAVEADAADVDPSDATQSSAVLFAGAVERGEGEKVVFDAPRDDDDELSPEATKAVFGGYV